MQSMSPSCPMTCNCPSRSGEKEYETLEVRSIARRIRKHEFKLLRGGDDGREGLTASHVMISGYVTMDVQ